MPFDLFTKAILLGILEGLTEFIPVSSTGHLILLGNLLEFVGKKADTFSVFIQLGAILAVVVLYYQRFRNLLRFTAADSNGCAAFSGVDGLIKLFVATLPALVLGALFHSAIKSYLFYPLPVALALIGGGLVMIFIEKISHQTSISKIEEITLRHCLIVGFFQCLAMWPGTSRSGSTMVGAMLLGFDRKTAAEFSFLMAVPVMCAAVAYDLLKSASFLDLSDVPLFLIGFTVSFITAVAAIRFFISMLQKFTLAPFGYYRILLGAAVLFFSLS